MTMLFSLIFLFLGSSSLYAHGIPMEDQQKIINGGYVQYLILGAKHMLTGYDHLLFLFGVVFFLTRFTDILKFITAFTLGHSITLIFATILKIHMNYYLIDAFIALTVCYKGFENIDGFKKIFQLKAPNLLSMVFMFGLVHGFGLSTRLQTLPLGTDNLVLKIISFNIGVEVGQVIALVFIMMLLAGWRKTQSFMKFSLLANSALIFAGMLLFLMQMHGYIHGKSPDEFAFSSDNHQHEHEQLRAYAHWLAHPDSPTPLDDDEILQRASKEVAMIVYKNETVDGHYLDESWLNLPDSAKKIFKKSDKYYAVAIENLAAGNTLYMVLRKTGGFVWVNLTGKFVQI